MGVIRKNDKTPSRLWKAKGNLSSNRRRVPKVTGLARELVPEWPTGKVAQALFELQGENKEQAEKLVATEVKT